MGGYCRYPPNTCNTRETTVSVYRGKRHRFLDTMVVGLNVAEVDVLLDALN